MKTLFINPSLRPGSKRRQLPVGLAYVMTSVKKSGYDFDLIDMDINDLSMTDMEKILGIQEYDIYAFGCIVTGYRYVKQIAEIIKKINPESLIIAGNSVATSIPKLLLENTKVDVAVLGESDITIVELLKTLEKNEDIGNVKGIVYKEDGRFIETGKRAVVSDIDAFGFPDWEIFELNKYNDYAHINVNVFSFDKVLGFPLNSARGCPYNCTFCYHVFKGENYRRYSMDSIIKEIIRLKEKYGSNFISFWDELTFQNTKNVVLFVDKVSSIGFKFGWEAPVRGDLFTRKDVSLLKDLRRVGCDNLAFSLESASPDILKAMNKRMNVSQFVEQTESIWQSGITPLTSVVFGYPQETIESIKLTIDVCEKCNIFPSVGFLLPLPGTSIYEWAKNNKYITNEVEYLERIGDRQDLHINLTSLSDDRLYNEVKERLALLAEKMGLELESVFKTVTYQKPKNVNK